MTDFTLPPGVEVPELDMYIKWLSYDCWKDESIDCDNGTCEIGGCDGITRNALAALCRVVREQDRMLRLAVSSYSVNEPDEAIELLRRRVREEGEA